MVFMPGLFVSESKIAGGLFNLLVTNLLRSNSLALQASDCKNRGNFIYDRICFGK